MLSVSWCSVYHFSSAPTLLTKLCCLCCGPQDTCNPTLSCVFHFKLALFLCLYKSHFFFFTAPPSSFSTSLTIKYKNCVQLFPPLGCPFPTHIVVFLFSHLLFSSEPVKRLPVATAISLFLTTPNLCWQHSHEDSHTPHISVSLQLRPDFLLVKGFTYPPPHTHTEEIGFWRQDWHLTEDWKSPCSRETSKQTNKQQSLHRLFFSFFSFLLQILNAPPPLRAHQGCSQSRRNIYNKISRSAPKGGRLSLCPSQSL